MIFTDEYFKKLTKVKVNQLSLEQRNQIVKPQNLKDLQIKMKDFMIDFLNPDNSEFMFHIVACIQLFQSVQNQYTNCDKITFKYLLNFCLDFDKFDKKYETQFQYQLCINQKLLEPYQKHFYDVHFNAPLVQAKNPLQYISLDLNSLKTKSKAFKNTVKQCIYNKEVRLFMILVQGSIEILIYKDNGKFFKKLSTKQNQHGNPFNIVQIAYLQIEKRIAALLSTNVLCIWDYPNFDYELNINLKEYCDTQQIRIMGSFCLQSFVTLNEKFQLLIWDVKNPQNFQKFEIMKKESNLEIIYFEEIKKLQVFVIVTNKNDLIFFDSRINKKVLQKKLAIKPIINIQYSSLLKSLILVTHNNNIPVFKITYQNGQFELNFIGRLIGHLNFVVCGCLIENLHVLITIDEQVHIKFWDLTQMTCMRSVKVQGKARVTNLFFTQPNEKLVIFSKKINLYKVEKQIETKYLNNPSKILDVFFNYEKGQIDVYTDTDYQVIDQRSGKIKFIKKYSEIDGITKDQQFLQAHRIQVVDNGRNFYIFDCEGNSFLVNSFFKVKLKLIKQSDKIRKLYIVKKDQLFMTLDENNLIVQMNQKEDFQHNQLKTLRKLKSLQQTSHQFQLIEFSLDMNLVLLSNQEEKIYIIDFEYSKVCGVMYFNNVNPLKAQILDQFGLIFVYLENNSIIILDFNYEKNSVSLNPLLKQISNYTLQNLTQHGRLLKMDLLLDKYKVTKDINDIKFCLSYTDGYIIILGLKTNLKTMKEKESYTNKNSYNSKRIMENNFAQNTEQNLKEFQFNQKKTYQRRNAYTSQQKQSCSSNELYYFEIEDEFQIQKYEIKFQKIFYEDQYFIISTNKKQQLIFKVHDLRGNLLINFDLQKIVPFKFNWKFDQSFSYFNLLQDASESYRLIFKKPSRKTQNIRLREVYEHLVGKSPSKIFLADVKLKKNNHKSQPVLNLQYYDKYSLLSIKHQELFKDHKKYNLQKISNELKQKKQKDWIFDKQNKKNKIHFQSQKQINSLYQKKGETKEISDKYRKEQKEKQEKIRQILFNQKNYEKTCEKFAMINLNSFNKQTFQRSLRKKKKNQQKRIFQKGYSQKDFFNDNKKENKRQKSQFIRKTSKTHNKNKVYETKMQSKLRLTAMLKQLDLEVNKAKNKKLVLY